MIKYTLFFFIVTLLIPSIAIPQKAEPTIIDFKVQAMYRAAKLTWKVKGDLKSTAAVQIFRADTFADGPYKEIGAVNIISGKSSYEYVDKSMGSEAKYYYKLTIKETDESFGPLPTRPYFSPPAT
ncbi:MAG: hypothetical protein FJ117_02985 [Deltaproteobacteria bacterium]|nr:hypothetical protein [Deltaproteobacteria bacterium]